MVVSGGFTVIHQVNKSLRVSFNPGVGGGVERGFIH